MCVLINSGENLFPIFDSKFNPPLIHFYFRLICLRTNSLTNYPCRFETSREELGIGKQPFFIKSQTWLLPLPEAIVIPSSFTKIQPRVLLQMIKDETKICFQKKIFSSKSVLTVAMQEAILKKKKNHTIMKSPYTWGIKCLSLWTLIYMHPLHQTLEGKSFKGLILSFLLSY